MISLTPYIVYNGNCEEAFSFYKTVFGFGELYLGRYKEVPQEARKYFPNALDENTMHGTLKFDKDTVIIDNDNSEIAEKITTTLRGTFIFSLILMTQKKLFGYLMNSQSAVK